MELKCGPLQNHLDAKAAHFRPTNVIYYHLHLKTQYLPRQPSGLYRVYKKKLNTSEIAVNFWKAARIG